MPEQDELNKKLAIKIKVVRRCTKETAYYEQDVNRQRTHINDLEQKDACPHEIKKQYEVLEETKRMIPNCVNSLEKAVCDLRAYVKSGANFDAELLTEAQALLQQ